MLLQEKQIFVSINIILTDYKGFNVMLGKFLKSEFEIMNFYIYAREVQYNSVYLK